MLQKISWFLMTMLATFCSAMEKVKGQKFFVTTSKISRFIV